MVTDPIADLLTRIRNGGRAKHPSVLMPNSKLKQQILRVLNEEGYVGTFEHVDGVGNGSLRVGLRFYDGAPVITGIQRESKPGQRRYVKAEAIPEVMNGYGVAILTTSQGVMTGKAATALGIGGEYICSVW